MRFALALVSFATSAALTGCLDGAVDFGSGGSEQDVKGADNGTRLSVTASAGEPVCLPSGNATVDLTGVLTSNASAAWADVMLSIDGGAQVSIDEVLPTDYSKDGRIKTYGYSYPVELTEGTHTLQICFIQPSGHTRMTACSEAIEVVVSCSENTPSTCPQQGPFGDTVGNHNLCAGAHNNNVEVQIKGDFGDTATVTVSGPNGFGFTEAIPHSGNSCVYHYNWDTRNNNGGIGTYSFTVEGAGNSETWSAELFCKTK